MSETPRKSAEDQVELARGIGVLLSALSDGAYWGISLGSWIRTVPSKGWSFISGDPAPPAPPPDPGKESPK